MKTKKSFIYSMILGIVFVCIGFAVNKNSYYSILFFSIGFGIFISSCIPFVKTFYYEMPSHRAEYEKKQTDAHIERTDERNIYLRMKAGALTNQLMFLLLLFLSFILTVLHTATWIIVLMFGLCILQYVIGVLLYKHFKKHF